MRKAAEDYHRERKGNCAQSVAHAWMDKNPGGGTSVEGFAGCGAGKAPGGLCGAVHASCELAGAEAAETIRREFAEKSGGQLKCREIRAANDPAFQKVVTTWMSSQAYERLRKSSAQELQSETHAQSHSSRTIS